MEDIRYLETPPQLSTIIDKTVELQFPMASEPLVGALLRSLAASKPGGRFLELGTGTGIATAWLLGGMNSSATIVSVDNDAAVQQVALECLGNDARLTLVVAEFADAMPGKYKGLEHALAVVKVGGFYVIDDMLPQTNWPDGHAAKVPVLMEQLAANPHFKIVPLVWASGVVVAVRRA